MTVPNPTRSQKRKRKVSADDDVKSMIHNTQAQANLLLQFLRQTHNDIKTKEIRVSVIWSSMWYPTQNQSYSFVWL
jgi:hypothetical protein